MERNNQIEGRYGNDLKIDLCSSLAFVFYITCVKIHNQNDMFKGRELIIATMHKKEVVIAPILERELGVICKTAKGFNTDKFGTFSGEIKRKDSAIATVRSKALAILEGTKATLAVASEGSFGPHPSSIFLPVNEEFVVLIDKKNNLEILGRYITTDTNFNKQKIESIDDLKDFESRIGFPEHGIIIKTSDENNIEKIWKDFETSEDLRIKIMGFLADDYSISVETDMRAMRNPTRMKAIAQATLNLVKNVKSKCPKCDTSGFSITKAIRGLRCSLCDMPTKSIQAYVYSCRKCEYSCERAKDNVTKEDPTFCDFCNP